MSPIEHRIVVEPYVRETGFTFPSVDIDTVINVVKPSGVIVIEFIKNDKVVLVMDGGQVCVDETGRFSVIPVGPYVPLPEHDKDTT